MEFLDDKMELTKSKLAIILSKLELFENPNAAIEQYPTDSEAAATALWFAYQKGDIEDKIITDLGCGTGLLGIGALLLGAKKCHFVDIDANAIEIAKRNAGKLELKNAFFAVEDITKFGEKTDTVIQNPPFGVQQKHADKIFLDKAFETATVVYSFHKIESREFIERTASNNGFGLTNVLEFDLPIKATQKFHKRRIYRFKVGCFRMEKAV